MWRNILFCFCFFAWQSLAWAMDENFLGTHGGQNREDVVHDHAPADDFGVTGTWGGARSAMQAHGVTFEVIYTGEYAKNLKANAVTANGEQKLIYHTNTDLMLTVDTEALGAWNGGTLFIHGLINTGGAPTDYTGDFQGYSNIEAPNQAILHEAWFEQVMPGDQWSVLLGIHDLNSEFYVSDYASLFLQSSFGIGPDVTGNVPVSIFPKAGLAMRLHVDLNEQLVFQAAVYDGDPEARKWTKNSSTFNVAELDWHAKSGTYKVGYWQHTASGSFGANQYASKAGAYMLIDQALMHWGDDGEAGVFFQYGATPKTENEVPGYVGAGLHIHGVIPGREEDDLGIAVAQAGFHATPNAEVVNETALELTYAAPVTPWLSIQPSWQLIKNAGGDKKAPTISAALLRFEVSL